MELFTVIFVSLVSFVLGGFTQRKLMEKSQREERSDAYRNGFSEGKLENETGCGVGTDQIVVDKKDVKKAAMKKYDNIYVEEAKIVIARRSNVS